MKGNGWLTLDPSGASVNFVLHYVDDVTLDIGICTAHAGYDNQPHFTPKAKNVLVIFSSGGCSHLDTFDYKPELQRLHNLPCPDSLLEGKRFAFIEGVPNMLGPQATFAQTLLSEELKGGIQMKD